MHVRARKLTEQQHRCVELVLQHMKEYLDQRFTMIVRAVPRYESPWQDLQWLLLQQLRNTIENEKMWGPNRFVVAELLCSNDKGKMRELFNPKNQVSIQVEVVEKREDAQTHKASDVLEIHDFRTFYGAMDPSIAKIASVMQTFMWWDLPDAGDLARFDFKMARYREVERHFNPQWQKFYTVILGRHEDESPPTQEEILDFETIQMNDAMESFCARRIAEPGYKLIMARRGTSHDDAINQQIVALSRQLQILASIKNGQALDGPLVEQFCRALNVSPGDLTPEKEQDYLSHLINEAKGRLRTLLNDQSGGETFSFKETQAENLRLRFAEVVGDRAERVLQGVTVEAPIIT